MDESIKVTCPCCKSILVIRRRDGELLETRKPLLEESSGDRFQDAFKKVKGRSKEVESKLEEMKRKNEEKKRTADDFFKDALKRAKESGDEKPFNPMDVE